MTNPCPLSLAAPRGHALAEAVQLAFAARGAGLILVPVQSPALWVAEGELRLTLRQRAEPATLLRDPIAMLELAEDLHPAQPLHPSDSLLRAEHREALAHLPKLATLLDRLTQSTDPRDVDLNTHLLRGRIAHLAPHVAPGQGVSLLDLAATPLLWRIDALDRSFDTHLLTGHDRLRARLDRLRGERLLAGLLDAPLLADWLQAVARRGGWIAQPGAQPDWSSALGPESRTGGAQESRLLFEDRRRKSHSIGSPTRIR